MRVLVVAPVDAYFDRFALRIKKEFSYRGGEVRIVRYSQINLSSPNLIITRKDAKLFDVKIILLSDYIRSKFYYTSEYISYIRYIHRRYQEIGVTAIVEVYKDPSKYLLLKKKI